MNLNISELGSCCPQLEGRGICLELLGSDLACLLATPILSPGALDVLTFIDNA